MGIQGLLQFIKEASEPIHVRKYKGEVVAVDTYCWLHKGAIACAEKLVKGEPTDKYVGFCMKFVNMLLSHGVKPVLVFDGCTLPSKKEVEKSRRQRRQANLLKGKQLLREGKLSEARDCFTRSINITHAMAHKVIKAARSQGVDCLVAPYEADAQLAYLNKSGIVQAIITEDSDLLAFGCKKVILKMDQLGNGLEIDQARLGMCKQLRDMFTEEKFRYMCILSGCDYLSSLRGIGLAKACKLLRLANNPDIVKVIKKIGHYLKMNIKVPEDYIKGFIQANNTFLYQLVFDPIKRRLIPLTAYEDDVDPETLSYAGWYIDDSVALQIALGNTDINTLEQIDDYNPDTAMPVQLRSQSWNDSTCPKTSANSIWHKNYQRTLESGTFPESTPQKENRSTKGIKRMASTTGLNLLRKPSVVKRPRSELPEDDLLNQYSTSCAKKTRNDTCDGSKPVRASEALVPDLGDGAAGKKSLSPLLRTRNKFATFLHRKNEAPGAIVVPGTKSRFFCNSPDSADWASEKETSRLVGESVVTNEETKLKEYDGLDGKKLVDKTVTHDSGDQIPEDKTVFADEESQTLKTSRFTRTISPATQRTLSCFGWPGSLKDFSRTPTPCQNTSLQPSHRKSVSLTSLPEKSKVADLSPSKNDESMDESLPLDEVGRRSQLQESLGLSPYHSDTSELSQPSKDSDSEVPGLYKSSSLDSLSTTKIKPLVPAKASGLMKKSASIQRRNHHNAENKPGLQIKISELWKNFGFKKDSEKLHSCKTLDPLSPVRDNIQLTP
ncbi:exonuclease 1 isoform X2 [Tenrec ecaudatus]|uniref:exonuclease 1 isoform X2 n=1 Tax=Tenrec ecaudatus TaxID=94439 RepID=UPI003F5A24E4